MVIATIVVPVKDEDVKIVTQLIKDTYTTFHGKVDIEVVDDGSNPPCPVSNLRHPVSLGYGAALKAGIRQARGKWIITMDGDGQHRIRDAQRLLEFIGDFPECAMVIGDRRIKEQTFKRWAGRKALNWFATLMSNRWIGDLNSGLRIFRRELALSYEPILCDQFSYTTTLTMSILTDGHKVDWLPIRVLDREAGESKVHLLRDGLRTVYYIFRIGFALRTRTIRAWWRKWKNE